MQNDIQTLLTSSRIEDRKEAIKLLIQQGGEDAMFQLAMLYKYDPDADIRHLAVQAGKFLKQQSAGSQSSVTTQEVRAVFGAQPEKPPTQSDRRTQTQENKPVTAARRTGELKAATDASRVTQENKPPTVPRRTQELKAATDASRVTQENKPVTAARRTGELKAVTDASRATQENKPVTASRRTQELRGISYAPPPPVEEPDVVDLADGEVPDYDYVEVSWQDEDKARGFVAAANMMYDEGKLKAAADYLRRAVDTNPNLRLDDGFVATVARITERPKQVALNQLLNPPDKRTITQESRPSGWGFGFGGEKSEKKKKSEPVPGELTWQDVGIDLSVYTVAMILLMLAGSWILVQGLRQPLNQAVTVVGTFPTNMTPTLDVSTVGQIVQVAQAFTSRYTPVRALGFALGFGVYALWSLLLQYVGIHLAATIPLAGFGSFKKLIRSLTWFNIALNVIVLILVMAFINGVLTGALNKINAGAMAGTTDLAGYLATQMTGLTGVICLSSFGVVMVTSFLIARVYSFGVGRGCAAQIIGAIIVSIISGALSSLTSPILALLIAV